MEKKKFNFKNFFILFCLCFLTFFTFVPFASSFSIPIAKADTTVSNSVFRSSDIITATLGTSSSSNINSFNQLTNDETSTSFWKFSFNIVADTLNLDNAISFYYRADSWHGQNYLKTDDLYEDSFYLINSISLNIINSLDVGQSHVLVRHCWYRHSSSGVYHNSLIGVSITRGNSIFPSLNMVSVEIGNYSNTSFNNYFNTNINSGYYNFVSYVDSYGWRFTYAIPFVYRNNTTITNFPAAYYSYRLYYINVDFSDNQMYKQGYDQGLIDNQQNIYNEGYSAGSIDGYGSGYTAGQNDSNTYSFLNLFGALLDAPIQTLTGLLNFNLLGVNLLGLFTGLLSLALLLFIIKLILGGR